MLNSTDFLNNVTKEVEVDLTQAFDRNFESKSFFNRKWPAEKYANSKGSQMVRSGKGRRSIKSSSKNGQIRWSSNLPYMSIHNEGGEIVVTKKMKSFFWAMYYKAAGAVSRSILQKDGSRKLFVSSDSKSRMAKQARSKSVRAKKMNDEAAKWKAMALLKVGTVMEIDQTQFIGWHPQVDFRIKKIVNHNLSELNKDIIKTLKA